LIIVSNTSPIIALKSVDKLHLLEDIFQEVIIPRGVSEELSKGESNLQRVRDESWIKEKRVKDQLALEILTLFLDRGEAEAIILAKELSADRLLIDEKAGRNVSKRLKLKIIGTLGILLLAKEERLIPQIAETIDKLKESNFWIGKEVEQQILKKARESN